jgi:hypothetical protein
VRSVLTKHQQALLNTERLLNILDHLCAEKVILLKKTGLSFSHAEFLGRAGLRAWNPWCSSTITG